MGLITETNEQYYAGSQSFIALGASSGESFTTTFNTDLVNTVTGVSFTNFSVSNADTKALPIDFNTSITLYSFYIYHGNCHCNECSNNSNESQYAMCFI